MKNGLTEIVFILDRSGSMGGLEGDTIGGYNALIEKQKKLGGECRLTTVLFDDRYELLHNRLNLMEVRPLTNEDYYVRGTTALLDAVGRSIDMLGFAQKHAAPGEDAEKVMVIITTDGMENASREYSYQKVQRMIKHQTEKYGWEFLFLGANIDAVEAAKNIGIDATRAVRYEADSLGTLRNFEVLDAPMTSVRKGRTIDAAWKSAIEEDYRNRGSKN